MAEWSKAVVSGTILKGRGFKSLSRHHFFNLYLGREFKIPQFQNASDEKEEKGQHEDSTVNKMELRKYVNKAKKD